VTWHGWWWQWLVLAVEAAVTVWWVAPETRRRVRRGLSRFNEWTQEPADYSPLVRDQPIWLPPRPYSVPALGDPMPVGEPPHPPLFTRTYTPDDFTSWTYTPLPLSDCQSCWRPTVGDLCADCMKRKREDQVRKFLAAMKERSKNENVQRSP
jgi:hypothetical protein